MSDTIFATGRTYHFMPRAVRGSGCYYFLNSNDNALQEHGARFDVDSKFLRDFRNYLAQRNKLCKQYLCIGEALANNADNMEAVLNVTTHDFEISAITSEDFGEGMEHVLRVVTKNGKGCSTIPSSSPLFEPLCYPMLATDGEGGWHEGVKKEVPFGKYMASKLLRPDLIETGDDEFGSCLIGHYSKIHPDCFFPSNRVNMLYRVGQTYTVDMLSRIIDTRMQWHKDNKNLIFGKDSQKDLTHLPAVGSSNGAGATDEVNDDHDDHDDHDDVDDVDDSGSEGSNSDESESDSDNDESGQGESSAKQRKYKKSFLAESMHGSRRYLKKKAMNGLAVAAEYGKSTVFLTVTTNLNWKELRDALPPGQTAYDNPLITNRIFKKKLDALIFNLRHGKYFGGRETEYDIRSIEYQHRGLPHAHLVIRLKNAEFDSAADEIAFIDAHFSTQLVDATVDPEGHKLVRKFMVHHHSTGVNGCRNRDGYGCNKGFLKTKICETSLDAKGYPTYARRKNEDLSIVVHNLDILKDWKGHACCEYSGGTYTILYLYKYIFKGKMIMI